MKQKISLFSVLALSAIIGFTSCKKDKDASKQNVDFAAQSDDQAQFSAEMDAFDYEAGLAMDAYHDYYASGRNQIPEFSICDANIKFKTDSYPKTITITYDGSNCAETRTRTGVVVISIAQNTNWTAAGAAVSISFDNFKVKRLSDNKSIVINGTKTFTNVSGGLLRNLSSEETITHAITSSGLSVTFDDGTVRSWQVAKQRVFTYNDGAVVSISGTHTEGELHNIAEWGTNRLGLAFATSTTEPVVVRQNCSFRVTGGVVKHTVGSVSATATFGLDAQGSPVSCPDGSYYCKLVYTGPNGNMLTFILPY